MADNHSGGMVRVKLSGELARAIGRSGDLRFRLGSELRAALDCYHESSGFPTLGISVADLLGHAYRGGRLKGGRTPSRRVRETLRAELKKQSGTESENG